jgi:hypothetical protein
VSRLELVLLAFFAACWAVVALHLAGLAPLTGSFPLDLYPLYGVAGLAGSLAGNVYVARARRLPREQHRRTLLVYFAGPPGLLFLLRAMAPAAVQAAAPLVPVWAFGVFAVFFVVPLSVSRPR